MQCKDIPDKPILAFLRDLNGTWANWCFENDTDVTQAFPVGAKRTKLVIAKMRSLIKRGLVDGCGCGCRGDFVITDKGKMELEKTK